MPIKIRLKRIGAKKNPHYKLVVSDVASPRDGRFIEIIGHYDGRNYPDSVNVDVERARYWLASGAAPTAAAMKALKQAKVFDSSAESTPTAAEAPAEA